MSISAAQAFVDRWEQSAVNEKGTAQQHFVDLCRLLSIQTPVEANPRGDWYRFEKPLKKEGGGAGFADVWRDGVFVWEYKTKGKSLTLAEQQIRNYKPDLGNPPVLIVSDIARYEVYIEFTGFKTRVEKFANTDLLNAQTRDLLRAALTNPQTLRPTEKTITITEQIAKQFGDVARLVERRGHDPHDVAHFFMKLLFAMFAEDIGLLPNNLLSETLHAAIFNAGEFNDMIKPLFGQMRSGGYWGPGQRIPHFNGGLFDDDFAIPLTVDEIQFLYSAARQDWRDVEPSIFGTLFERALDPAKRAQLGAHYTSRDDILLLVEPVLMQPLQREWAAIKADVEALRPQYDVAAGMPRQRFKNQIMDKLLAMSERLSTITVLDAACGSGNFLYVALQQLKDLEREVITYAVAIGVDEIAQAVSPRQLLGIEKNPFAAELAQVVVWIGDLQWNTKHGFPNDRRPVLQTLDTIRCGDAILAYDAHTGQPVEPEWPAADVILGNPPFLGGKRLRSELGDQYVDTVFTLYDGRVPREADLVTYWFEKARAMIERGATQRAGLLATNSIRGGANRKVLERIKRSGDMFMAWSDRPWILDGAAVRVSMVGFDGGAANGTGTANDGGGVINHAPTQPMLDGQPVAAINADLTGAVDLTQATRLHENADLAFMGDTKGGPFDIAPEVAAPIINATLNANGRPNSDVVVPWVNGLDITRRPRGMWIIDFGVDMPEHEAAQYEQPFEYVQQHVKPERMTNNRAAYRERWWIHMEPRPAMRKALVSLSRYIATPRVAKHRIFVWVAAGTLPDSRVYVFAREDDYFMGVLHSRLHEVWSLATSSRHGVGNDPTYNNTTCFETFPFPWSPGTEPQADPRVAAIAAAARELLRRRDVWLQTLTPAFGHPSPVATGEGSGSVPPSPVAMGEGGQGDEGRYRLPDLPLPQRTLTNLYNRRPDWLTEAHAALDAAVVDAYGWPHDLPDDAILQRLLALNAERARGS